MPVAGHLDVANTGAVNRAVLTLADLARPDALFDAWQQAERRKAGPGTDGQTVQVFGQQVEEHLEGLSKEIREGGYQPRPAQRIWMVKDSGGERGITIFTVRDRVALGAMRRTLGRLIGPTLSTASFAYREGLGALRAAHRLIEHRRSGRGWVVRSDIKEFFDTISHEILLEQLRVFLDARALELFGTILRTPIRDGYGISVPERGVAQGSPISPMLANLYLSGFDAALNCDGRGFVRFADDFVIAALSVKGAAEGLEIAQAQLEGLELRLNDDKTRIVSFEQGFDFLGFHFDADTVRVSETSLAEFKAHLEALLVSRFEQFSPGAVKKANDLIRGWRNYFQLGDVRKDYAALEEWIEARFGHKARQLERLLPDARGQRVPQLGGYGRVSRERQPRRSGQANTASARPQKRQRPYPNVKLDANDTPLTVRRNKAVLNVATLPALPETRVSRAILDELEQASLFHRANTACRWSTPDAADAVSNLAAAMSGRIPIRQAIEAYDKALFAQLKPGADPRGARGTLRANLRRIAWAALLEAGIDLGPEQPRKTPTLGNALADAYECLTADLALLAASRNDQLHAPQGAFERSLAFKPAYQRPGVQGQAHATAWMMILRLEAEAMRRMLETNGQTVYRVWRFGLP